MTHPPRRLAERRPLPRRVTLFAAVYLHLSGSTPENVDVDVQVEFLLRLGGERVIDDTPMVMTAGQPIGFNGAVARYRRGNFGLSMTGGCCKHRWFLKDFNIETGWAEANCVRLVATAHTPFARTFTIAAARTAGKAIT